MSQSLSTKHGAANATGQNNINNFEMQQMMLNSRPTEAFSAMTHNQNTKNGRGGTGARTASSNTKNNPSALKIAKSSTLQNDATHHGWMNVE